MLNFLSPPSRPSRVDANFLAAKGWPAPSRQRGRHRLERHVHRDRTPQPLIWIISVAVFIVVLVIVLPLTLLPSAGESFPTATNVPLARQVPQKSPEAFDYLAALAREKIAVDPRRAVLLGHAVCGEIAVHHSSPFNLSLVIQEMDHSIRKMDAARLVDVAAKHCDQLQPEK